MVCVYAPPHEYRPGAFGFVTSAGGRDDVGREFGRCVRGRFVSPDPDAWFGGRPVFPDPDAVFDLAPLLEWADRDGLD